MPETVAAQVEERQDDIAASVERQNLDPILRKQVTQIGDELDQIRSDCTLLECVEYRE
jgi:hypothetical protein